MSLLDVTTLKAALRVSTDAELVLLTLDLASAKAMVEQLLGVPLTAVSTVITDRLEGLPNGRGRSKLLTRKSPLGATVAITDMDGTTVVATDYTHDRLSGIIHAVGGVGFDNPPYTITVDVGMSAHPSYATRIEPVLNQAILDIASDLFQRRTPSATGEGAGDTSVNWDGLLIPERAAGRIRALRRTVMAL